LGRARLQEPALSEVERCRSGRGKMRASAPEGCAFRAGRYLWKHFHSYRPAFRAMPRGAQQRMDSPRQSRKARVLRQSLGVAVVDLLNDYRDFEAGKRQIEDHVAGIAAARD